MRIQHPVIAAIVAALSAVVSSVGCSSAPADEVSATEGEGILRHLCPEIILHCGNGETCSQQNGCPVCMCNAPPPTFAGASLALGSASESSYARGPDGTLRAWGQNNYGQLDDGTTSNRFTPTAMLVPDATQLAIGSYFGCALRADTTVSCWGNVYDAGVPANTALQTIPGLTNVTSIAAADQYACAVTGGQVWCWGQIPSSGFSTSVPTQVAGITNAVGLSTMTSAACALLADGTVDCWGSTLFGQMGNGQSGTSNLNLLPATPIPSLSGVSALTTSEYGTCATETNGQVWCWGLISAGELLNAWPANGSATPIHVAPLDGASALELGYTSCAVFSGSVQCWGWNRGRLGNGNGAPAYSLTPIAGPSNITEIGGANDHTCARSSFGNVWCWGDDYDGQVGVSVPTSGTGQLLSPVQVL